MMRKRFLIITMISSMLFIGCKTKSAIGAKSLAVPAGAFAPGGGGE